MKIGLFTEFSYPGKSEQQTYADVLEQIAVADELGYDFFSITESYGKDLFSCSPFPLGLYVAAAQRARRIRFLTGIISMPIHHPAMLASQVAAADLLTDGRIMLGIGRGHPWVINRMNVDPAESSARFEEGIGMLVECFKGDYIEKLDGKFWQIRDFKLSPPPVQEPHPPIYTAAATTPDSASFAGKVGQGLVQPGYLGIPFDLVRGLTETYRKNLPAGHKQRCRARHSPACRARPRRSDRERRACAVEPGRCVSARQAEPAGAKPNRFKPTPPRAHREKPLKNSARRKKRAKPLRRKARTSWRCGARRKIAWQS